MKPNERFKNGGGFCAALLDAYQRADRGNARAIEKAFPHLFNLEQEDIESQAFDLISLALSNDYVIEITHQPRLPLAMGHYQHIINVRKARSQS